MTTLQQTDAFRAFNRFHTRLVGALDESLLDSGHTLPQARVLHEIASAPRDRPLSARDIGQRLRLDTGYLSRLLAGLEADGLVVRQPSDTNARRLGLSLTPQGRDAYAQLSAASAREIEALLAPLSPAERDELVGAMARIRRLLGDAPEGRTFVLRDPVPGDMGWIVHRQARLYATAYGWDASFEAMVAEIAAQFVREFRPDRERCWVAESEGEIVGSAFVVRQDDQTAKLRMLYVEPGARGMGLGRRLVDECLRFATERGYQRMVLWTNDILVSARRIYQAAGFQLVESSPHRSFGKDLVSEVWERAL
ncbi:bifunctional helix-turn-helix transcriptional regulator/GNAT family N-acetyltransferase [Hydrogenophaga electricum]|uniref:GNAT family N-acetyltransferase n=1 Tax=Hydrogenophaga electricum TaxID=1230953 RepID=A0ABQ6C7L5_9BURK|nr:bifunctional helix-turn-helix transcriptional regulator/GNAT family N-acetyltransferase [Hydrogenophaga electricum]GLS16353.1 GNAT family N-acetyltransferase [Hydrogenophaga electricum]